MKEINDGGKAFPWCGDLNDMPTINLGISMRDYFAAKAMQAIIAKHPAVIEGIDEVEIQRITAAGAYSYSDAMLAERAK